MTERPIIFSAPMVRAILDGRKTMTRRILKPQGCRMWQEPLPSGAIGWFTDVAHRYGRGTAVPLRYAGGDRLWVRETWAEACELDDNDHPASEMRTYYRADGEPFSRWLDPDTDEWRDGIKWRSPIHMPRWASRITLELTAVKVERLQEITEEDAWAEGCKPFFDKKNPEMFGKIAMSPLVGPREAFKKLWNSIHGPGAWEANPWVAAISFERVA